MVSAMSTAAAPISIDAATKKLLGSVLATGFNTDTDQMSVLQRERLNHALEVPAVLEGAPTARPPAARFVCAMLAIPPPPRPP
jgi:hypothetical protein